jgi:hypothetical protein
VEEEHQMYRTLVREVSRLGLLVAHENSNVLYTADTFDHRIRTVRLDAS